MIFKKIIINISSLKFAIGLIIFIAISSGIGTFIPQGNRTEEYIDLYNSEPIFGLLDGNKVLAMELDHIYTSKWFLLSLVLLCISLASCSFRRQIPSLKASLKWIDYDNEKKFNKLKLSRNLERNSTKSLISNSEKYLKHQGWERMVNENRISARKGIIGKLGPIIVHIGLILLLVGSAYGNLSSQKSEQYLGPNETLDLINDNSNQKLTIKLKDFVVEREIDGKPKQFISTLSLKEVESNETEIRKAKVNHPIRFKGLTIYQADWAISNVVLRIDDIVYQLKLKPIPEIGEQIWGLVLELGKNNKKNYLLTIENENGPVKFYDVSDFSEKKIYMGNKNNDINSSNVEVLNIIKSSGLIIKNDPSIPFIYISFALIMLGTILSLIPTKQLWILINKDSKIIYIGGLSNRNLSGFENEFAELTNKIKNI